MSPRAIRRAAEHKARKLDAKQAQLKNPGLTEAPLTERTPERTNLSTGPRTPEGKAISSLNALRTGLTGRTVLLRSDDADLYAAHVEQYRAEFSPVGYRETELVQSLADTAWRLARIPGLEMAMYAVGRREFANAFDDHDESLRPALIKLQTHLKYEKQLRNLQLQESRLHRRYTAEAKELRELQAERTEAQPARGQTGLPSDRPTNPNSGRGQTGLPSDRPTNPNSGRGQTGLPSDHSTSPTRRSDPASAPTQFEFSTALPLCDAAAAVNGQFEFSTEFSAANVATSYPSTELS